MWTQVRGRRGLHSVWRNTVQVEKQRPGGRTANACLRKGRCFLFSLITLVLLKGIIHQHYINNPRKRLVHIAHERSNSMENQYLLKISICNSENLPLMVQPGLNLETILCFLCPWLILLALPHPSRRHVGWLSCRFQLL